MLHMVISAAHQTHHRHVKSGQEAAAAFGVQLQGHGTAMQQEQDMQQELQGLDDIL